MPDPKPKIDDAQLPRSTKAARFERNGWIGLAITLAICLAAYLIFSLKK